MFLLWSVGIYSSSMECSCMLVKKGNSVAAKMAYTGILIV